MNDPEALHAIFERLGLQVVYRYQKHRTIFRARGIEICLDETPIGNYLELEGDREGIDSFAEALGYSPKDYINLSYRALHEQAFRGTGREPGDLLFENDDPSLKDGAGDPGLEEGAGDRPSRSTGQPWKDSER